jgi:hypothetical protein
MAADTGRGPEGVKIMSTMHPARPFRLQDLRARTQDLRARTQNLRARTQNLRARTGTPPPGANSRHRRIV